MKIPTQQALSKTSCGLLQICIMPQLVFLGFSYLVSLNQASFLLRLRQQTLQRSCNASEIGGEKRACEAGKAA
jgi:hypothetical protein